MSSVALFGIYWPSRGEGQLEGLGGPPAFPSFIVFSTRWKESRLIGVSTARRKQSGYELKARQLSRDHDFFLS